MRCAARPGIGLILFSDNRADATRNRHTRFPAISGTLASSRPERTWARNSPRPDPISELTAGSKRLLLLAVQVLPNLHNYFLGLFNL